MPLFKYIALDGTGKVIAGTDDSPDREGIFLLLRQKGHKPLLVEETAGGGIFQRIAKVFAGDKSLKWSVSLDELEMFFRIMAILLPAGVTFIDALELAIGETENRWFQKRLVKIRDAVREGMTFADAMRQYPKAFPVLVVSAVEAGEASGTLPDCFERLANMYQTNAKLRRDVITALTYPSVVLLFFNILVVLIVTQTPRIIVEFVGGQNIDKVIKYFPAVIQFCYWVNKNSWVWAVPITIILTPAIMIIVGKKYRKSKMLLARAFHAIPLVGAIVHHFALVRLIEILCMMNDAGMETGKTMNVLKRSSGHILIEDALDRVEQNVLSGARRPDSMAREPIFPKLFVELLRAGEESGDLSKMMRQVGIYYYTTAKAATDRLVALIDPIMIVGIGAMVGPVIVAIYKSMMVLRELYEKGLL